MTPNGHELRSAGPLCVDERAKPPHHANSACVPLQSYRLPSQSDVRRSEGAVARRRGDVDKPAFARLKPLAIAFATCFASCANSCTTGLRLRFLSVKIAIGIGRMSRSIG